jgi:hypothetical protein
LSWLDEAAPNFGDRWWMETRDKITGQWKKVPGEWPVAWCPIPEAPHPDELERLKNADRIAQKEGA